LANPVEHAQEAVHHEAHHASDNKGMKRVAVLVSCLAAILALIQVGEKHAQNEYLTSHISLTNDWAFYQAKNLRSVVRGSEAALLETLGNPTDPAFAKKIKDAKDYVARMRDEPETGEGMKQIAEKAKARTVVRDKALHEYHAFEYAASAVEIAIVLASVSALTAVPALAIGAGTIGIGAGAFALGVALHLW
jgi:hypothetical protein